MADTARLRVLIADDYPPMAAALERVVSFDCDVVGRLTDGSLLLAETKRLQPDILLLDLRLPNVNSLSACEEIRSLIPRTRVIILTGGLNPDLRPRVLAAGASAFIDKAAPQDLLTAIANTQSSRSDERRDGK
jgi:two-component system invasion response regulator UvrY